VDVDTGHLHVIYSVNGFVIVTKLDTCDDLWSAWSRISFWSKNPRLRLQAECVWVVTVTSLNLNINIH